MHKVSQNCFRIGDSKFHFHVKKKIPLILNLSLLNEIIFWGNSELRIITMITKSFYKYCSLPSQNNIKLLKEEIHLLNETRCTIWSGFNCQPSKQLRIPLIKAFTIIGSPCVGSSEHIWCRKATKVASPTIRSNDSISFFLKIKRSFALTTRKLWFSNGQQICF